MEKGEKTLILLPGPPNELIPMFQESVIPYLKGRCSDAIVSAMIKSCGIGESKVAAMLNDIIEEQTNPTIATYAKTGEVDIRVTASAPTEKEAKKTGAASCGKDQKPTEGCGVYDRGRCDAGRRGGSSAEQV